MKTRWMTLGLAAALSGAILAGPAMAQGRGRGPGNGTCNGTQQRIHRQLRDGSGHGRQMRNGQGYDNGLRLRDGSGPNPNCPLKQK